jgi:hypothetical protein
MRTFLKNRTLSVGFFALLVCVMFGLLLVGLSFYEKDRMTRQDASSNTN